MCSRSVRTRPASCTCCRGAAASTGSRRLPKPPDGGRRSLKLEFAEPSREGVHALKRTWPKEGTWTLVIKANQGPDDAATAVVDLGPDGEVATIRVPTMQRGEWTVPAPVSLGEVDAALRARAATLARRS